MNNLPNIDKILFSEQDILQRVRELGKQISSEHQNVDILLICILKGALVFTADLMRCLELNADLDFIQISSYGNKTESSGKINLVHDITTNIENKSIIIVDDIIDSGLTLSYVQDYLLSKKPSSIKTCVLLNKPARRAKYVNADYIGFDVPDNFVVGYGLDFKEQYRGLRYIAKLDANTN
ncbi:TPA: hypoxanthine phosphoribosyltransferase [bacterium]|nr:hypoxanthine phosphoribosyltransferase [bacterium]